MVRLLQESGFGQSEAFYRVGQAVSECLSNDDKEKKKEAKKEEKKEWSIWQIKKIEKDIKKVEKIVKTLPNAKLQL